MEIIILSKAHGTTARLRLSWSAIACSLVVIGGIASSLAYWGYARGGDAMIQEFMNNPARATQIWQREIITQRQFLNGLHQDLSADLSAFAASMGKMQAQLTRLDAAAERVVKAARLDAKEFNFDHDPAIGGPHDARAEPPQWSDLLANLDAVKAEVQLREDRLSALETLMQNKQLHDDMKPAGGPLNNGWISSGFGYRTDPVTGEHEFHEGLDFAGKPGEPVRAVAAGVVTWSGTRWGYGNLVEISHGNGYITRYAHNRANLVAVGEIVSKNQSVALLGATGHTTGPHVHFEVVHNGDQIDPASFVRGQGNARAAAMAPLRR